MHQKNNQNTAHRRYFSSATPTSRAVATTTPDAADAPPPQSQPKPNACSVPERAVAGGGRASWMKDDLFPAMEDAAGDCAGDGEQTQRQPAPERRPGWGRIWPACICIRIEAAEDLTPRPAADQADELMGRTRRIGRTPEDELELEPER